MNEECGVFGVFAHDEAAKFTVYGLHALQHRGQEGVGIAAYDANDNKFNLERHMGLVGDVFGDSGPTANLKGRSAIGHVRYSTTGGSLKRNVQPFFADVAGGGIAVAHNGNLTNAKSLREELQARGAIFYATSDTEVIVHLVATSRQRGMVNRLIDALHQVEGAYSLVALTRKRMIGVRDPLGVRPLALGRMGDAWVLASETCAFDIIGAQFVRDVEPGELVEHRLALRPGVQIHRLRAIEKVFDVEGGGSHVDLPGSEAVCLHSRLQPTVSFSWAASSLRSASVLQASSPSAIRSLRWPLPPA